MCIFFIPRLRIFAFFLCLNYIIRYTNALMISSRKQGSYLHRDEISLCPEKLRNCNCTEGNVKMQYDTKKQVATQLCLTKCPCSQYYTQYGCNMKWTQDHSKVNSISHLHMETILPLFICYHIALIPLLKIVQKDICLENGPNATPTIYTRV